MLEKADTPDLAGLRKLTPDERKQRSDAMACLNLSKKSGTADCSQNISISVFFDGTGNNFELDVDSQKHSNVARLWQTHREDDDATGRYRIYIEGIGTKFEAGGETGDNDLRPGFALGGDKRLEVARKRFDALIDKAKARAGNPKHPIRMINLALFGFSRGAALARVFAVRIAKDCKMDGEIWRYQGYPIRLYFMGLFDTVASVGIPGGGKVLDHSPVLSQAVATLAGPLKVATGPVFGRLLMNIPKDGHYAWAQDLHIPAMVEQCLHYVAAHEVRDSFPLDSVRDHMSYPSNTHEIVYPGVHSDVGGGYAPGQQARALNDEEKLSQIPLLDMHRAARVAGVPLQALEVVGAKIKVNFAISAKTISLFQAYQSATQSHGPVEQQFSQHAIQLYRARGYLAWKSTRMGQENIAAARVSSAKDVLKRLDYQKGLEEFPEEFRKIQANGIELNDAMQKADQKMRSNVSLSLREASLATAFQREIKPTQEHANKSLLEFFDYLVHDSAAGFGKDFSKIANWRTIYFGDSSYEAANDYSPKGASALMQLWW